LFFEVNNKNIIPFSIEESASSTVSGLIIQNVGQAGAAFVGMHNRGNRYLNNTIRSVDVTRSPAVNDTTRGMWIGNVSDTTQEVNVEVSGNTLIDVSGTAIAVHGSGITVTDNNTARLNWGCIKVLPLGGYGSTLVANNKCSGAGAKWVIGGGIMTEYWNSSDETTIIRDNLIEAYAESDLSRIPDSPSNGISIANPVGKMTRNVQILNNTIRNVLYDGVQVSGSLDGFVIDSNLIERTFSGRQWNGIAIQGDTGKSVSNGVIRRNLIRGKVTGILLAANGGVLSGLTLEKNAFVSVSEDGVHIEVKNGGEIAGVGASGLCFAEIGRSAIWDNRPRPLEQRPLPILLRPRFGAVRVQTCADPRLNQ